MFTRLLVPLDGSERAERALPVAARIARASVAADPAPCLILLRAVTVPVTYGVMYEGQALQWRLIRDETELAQTYLGALARADALAGLAVETLVKVGNAATIILDAAEDRRGDLVVMTSHGRTGAARWLLGSVAEHVARQSAVPVLVLPQTGPAPTGPHPAAEQPLRMLVPLDGSPFAEAALAPAVALAQALSAPERAALHLGLVLLPFEADVTSMPEGLALEGARTYLSRVAAHLRDTYPKLTVGWSVVAKLDAAEALMRLAAGGEDAGGAGAPSRCDLIAMATHGRSGMVRWALGSITERVLHSAELPLLIVRPRLEAAREAPDEVGPFGWTVND
jgi:nucleotide-binding universal stress UspA family protein